MCPSVAYEMLVSHSPPVFSHSPPTGFLSDYTPFRLHPEQLPRTCRSTTPPSSLSKSNKLSWKMPASPKRPCLVIRAVEAAITNEEDPTSPTRLKKRVVFADDKGMSLTHVRVMTEPSNVPPLWSYRFLAQVTQGLSAEPEAQDDPWKIAFPQPASDYIDFRKKLETQKVSLENVIVKEIDEVIVGTVKVSNLSFTKEVIVRVSFDSWKTHEDVFCNFVPNTMTSASSSTYVLYDTFSFKIPLRARAKEIEFCVCFRCEGTEFWDNNDEKNYIIAKKSHTASIHKSFSSDKDCNEKSSPSVPIPKCADAIQAKMNSWSEFASWTHLDNSAPYW